MLTDFCSEGCFYEWERGGGKEKAPAEAEAPFEGNDRLDLDIGRVGIRLGDFRACEEFAEAIVGDVSSALVEKLEKALCRGLTYKVRVLVIRDAFNDYAGGKMTPGEFINKISAQVRHV